ncbi:MAG: asparagine synthase (glutamine-hydrolyzing) [Methylomonas sp.]|jgi:asparagine synthase (glutamine-hydrolysing)|uniref:asparagine synthase (glutamine-hydrolyzing) n=1 Tax=Methylomonas sp. TaxID=418 RepID=UPI0025CE8F18|nr:asparagine synthase (glutamine-hydrolyzing) [Methylomonas sp.]MCK9608091.1 asparagine synthase (glutamine-hydrolyzing) [Methylomonas sp.]
MCGIAGFIYADRNRPVDPETLVAMAAIQHHRGPDGFGWQARDGVGFSHARLSIIDLNQERGRQPFISADGRLMLTQNGELYDYQRLRADLTARGDRFRSKSDSELILHLYPRLGLDASLPHLRGEFAFALHDSEQDVVHLVRDRFGVKPLYWTEIDGGLVFGSELKVLFAHPEVTRSFDSAGLYHQLMQTMVPGSTAFAGVHQVKPGHVVSIERRDGRLRISDRRYWDMPFPQEHQRGAPGDQEQYIDGVRERLIEAVQLRLEADVPVGCYLSGGIDSCSIIGLATASTQGAVKAFTIGFDNADYDETPIATEMAQATGADQEILRLNATHLYDHFEETLWHTERTIYNTLGVAKLLMSRRVNEIGYKVVLTGEGSDELFGGYPAFRRDMFLHGLDHMPPDERREWEAMLAESNKLFTGAMLSEDTIDDPALNAKVGFTPSCLQPWLASARRVPDLLHPDRRTELAHYSPGAAIADALDRDALQGRHPLDRAQYVWIKTMLEGQILTWGGDRVDMANSMEARPPFLDHHLAEYAATLPPSMRIHGRTEKYVLREAMKGLLPETLYKREKFAFMAPPAHTDPGKWAAMRVLAERHLSPETIGQAGLLDIKGVNALFDLHDAPDTSVATQTQLDAVINHLLGVQILHERFIAADIPAQARRKAAELGWRA